MESGLEEIKVVIAKFGPGEVLLGLIRVVRAKAAARAIGYWLLAISG